MARGILIYAQTDRNGVLQNVVLELANTAQKLSEKLDNCEISAILFSDGTNLEQNKEILSKNGFNKVYIAKSDILKQYSVEYYSKIVIDLIKNIEPEIFLIGATTQGRELAPIVATNLNTGLTVAICG